MADQPRTRTRPDADLQAAVHAVVLSGLRTLTLWLWPLLLLFAPFDYAVGPREVAWELAALDVLLGLAFLADYLVLRAGWVPVRHANLAAGIVVLSVLPYAAANLWLAKQPVFSGGFVLWEVGISLVLLSWPWLLGLLALANGLWVALALRLPPHPDWSQYGFLLATATALSIAAHTARLRTVRRLERLRLEERARRIELENAQAAAQDARAVGRLNEIRTDFMNRAAHELATPMTPLMLELGLLRRGEAALPPEHRRSLGVLERNVQRLNELVQDLLESAKLESDRLVMAKVPVGLGEVFRQVAEEYRAVAGEAGVAVRNEAPAGLRVRADPRRLHQVVANLVGNAVKFTPRGGTVRLAATAADGWAEASVADTGRGLSAEEAAQLFQPFVQVGDPVQGGLRGSGLGLHICRGLVERMGGRIGAHSPGPGEGSTFWFRLPLEEEAPGPP